MFTQMKNHKCERNLIYNFSNFIFIFHCWRTAKFYYSILLKPWFEFTEKKKKKWWRWEVRGGKIKFTRTLTCINDLKSIIRFHAIHLFTYSLHSYTHSSNKSLFLIHSRSITYTLPSLWLHWIMWSCNIGNMTKTLFFISLVHSSVITEMVLKFNTYNSSGFCWVWWG